jgi:hypothetical protein
MPLVEMWMETDDVMESFSNEEIIAEYERRFKTLPLRHLLEDIYEEFRDRQDAPPALREYIWQTIGRVL